MVTIKDVARVAKVSPSTVSRVISDHKSISESTKERVRLAMQELGYHPNYIARSLIKCSSHALGLILSRSTESAFSNPFFSEILRGIGKVAQKHQYTLALATAENYKDEAKQGLQMVMERRVDGLILLAPRVNDDLIRELSRNNYPFVVVGRVNGMQHHYAVNNDNIQAAYTAVRHLLNLGHRRIAFLNGPSEYTFCQDRYQGYCMALQEFGVAVDPRYVRNLENHHEDDYRMGKELLKQKPRPTAFFLTDDLMAIGVYRAVKEENLRIPQDVAVVGFNDDAFANLLDPPLTTVQIPIYEMGKTAAEMMIAVLHGKEVTPPQKILSSELIIRESCGAKAR
ncbi:LacI family DNA-binding transcriptional regulator [Capillibacterium thermochitinicola]|uniref:LacI family DNA-binding transcriptional regulator n=1 Tax=Capillibacterium thermochitinicola TaxID=2699427 RepID=A0A8J6HXW9_9FIRM|nr:LacI family DNA-binding transcriptional regulator [Capillibacterium thermochitinicola]